MGALKLPSVVYARYFLPVVPLIFSSWLSSSGSLRLTYMHISAQDPANIRSNPITVFLPSNGFVSIATNPPDPTTVQSPMHRPPKMAHAVYAMMYPHISFLLTRILSSAMKRSIEAVITKKFSAKIVRMIFGIIILLLKVVVSVLLTLCGLISERTYILHAETDLHLACITYRANCTNLKYTIFS